MGSPAYAAPEQIKGQFASPQTDLYSLGIILFELLTGQHPFPELSELSQTDLLAARSKNELPSLMIYHPDLPPILNQVLQQMSALNPQDRPSDALSAAHALREAAELEGRRSNLGSIRVTALNQDLIPNPYKGLRAFQESDASNFFWPFDLSPTFVETDAGRSPLSALFSCRRAERER